MAGFAVCRCRTVCVCSGDFCTQAGGFGLLPETDGRDSGGGYSCCLPDCDAAIGLVFTQLSAPQTRVPALRAATAAFGVHDRHRRARPRPPLLPPAQIIALSLSYTLLLPVILALVMDKSDRATAALDSSLQFSVVLLGSYAAGFSALRLAKAVGYTDAYWVAVYLAILVGLLLYLNKNLFNYPQRDSQ